MSRNVQSVIRRTAGVIKVALIHALLSVRWIGHSMRDAFPMRAAPLLIGLVSLAFIFPSRMECTIHHPLLITQQVALNKSRLDIF